MSTNDISSEESEMELLMEVLNGKEGGLVNEALNTLRGIIKSSTTSMTSVPKPLKFLSKHFEDLKNVYEKVEDVEVKKNAADVVSVVGMIASESRECLKYKILAGANNIGEWGHEYVRHLAGEIAQEWYVNESVRSELLQLTKEILPYNLEHNAEAEACDLAMEIEQLDMIDSVVGHDHHQRVCAYLVSCVPYVPEPENTKLLVTALNIYKRFEQWPQALRVALQLNNSAHLAAIIEMCPDPIMRKQLAFMIGRQQVQVDFADSISNADELNDIATNTLLNVNFLALGRELDILEPKTPDEVYKTHLDGNRALFGNQVDSARQNLAASFVSGFVNAGFGRDKLLTEDGNKWLYKNKEHGMLSATASLGLILLWDVDGGLGQIDKYLYSAEDYIKAGALLACGIVNCGVRNECDPALALLSDYVSNPNQIMRTGAILGLGLAYVGTNREDIITILHPVLIEPATLEVKGLAALALGLISVGTCNAEVTTPILQCLMDRSPAEFQESNSRFIALGLALCCLGKQEEAEAISQTLQVLTFEPYRAMATTLLDVCAYAGTGNVLKIQNLLHICSEHYETTKTDEKKKKDEKNKKTSSNSAISRFTKDSNSSTNTANATSTTTGSSKTGSAGGGANTTAPSTGGVQGTTTTGSTGQKKEEDEDSDDDEKADLSLQQAVATLGIALVATGEDIGTEMAFRSLGHLLRYCEPTIRRAVPLALALLSVSNPRLTVLDTLSKFSHDMDVEVSLNSIFAMGIVGAGTNNARVAAMLRQLSQFHQKDANSLFMVRIAQGLVHLGKGTLGLSPFHSDRQLLSPVAMAGLFSTLFTFLDVRGTILGKGHYMLYCLATAMNPRMLATFDENLKPLPISVRVGQAVDTVGVAGRPKTITGFQTYTTPVLLGPGERAELATDQYLSLTPILEGFVILRKNPDAAI